MPPIAHRFHEHICRQQRRRRPTAAAAHANYRIPITARQKQARHSKPGGGVTSARGVRFQPALVANHIVLWATVVPNGRREMMGRVGRQPLLPSDNAAAGGGTWIVVLVAAFWLATGCCCNGVAGTQIWTGSGRGHPDVSAQLLNGRLGVSSARDWLRAQTTAFHCADGGECTRRRRQLSPAHNSTDVVPATQTPTPTPIAHKNASAHNAATANVTIMLSSTEKSPDAEHISWTPPTMNDTTTTTTSSNTSTGDDTLNDTVSVAEMMYDGENGTGVVAGNVTCEGAQDYCNLTREEYIDMLITYLYPTWSEMVLIGLHVIVFFIGLIGNALVCIAVYTNYTMRTVTNIFIVNLAVADFFVILFCLPPTVLWDVSETWFFGETMCKVVLYFQNVAVAVSVLTLTFISIDRWYAICFPLRYVSTNVRAIGSIAFIWGLALITDIPEFMDAVTRYTPLRFDIELFTQCVSTWDRQTEIIYTVSRALLLYFIPLLLMSVAYYKIVRVLWKSDTIPGHRESRNTVHTCGYIRSTGPAANSSTMGQLRARRKAAKMLVAVVVMFAVCYFPVHLLSILRLTLMPGQSEMATVLSLISHWLCYANSAINPVIYNFMSGKFRREFRNALDKCRCVRARIEDRFGHSQPACSRTNHMSPSSRSNYQLTSLRDLNSIRDRQMSLQTSFLEASAPGGGGGGVIGGGNGSGGGVNGHGHHHNHHHYHGGAGAHPLNRRLSHLQHQPSVAPLLVNRGSKCGMGAMDAA